jgi:predicted phosphodiesterase
MKTRYLVLSDMHFGTQESSVNESRYRKALIDEMVSKSPWEEIIFIGDLLDINLATFTLAIEGGKDSGLDTPLSGFRQFLKELDAGIHGTFGDKGLKDLAKKWVYVPGNHDYKVWDMLSAKVVCEDVLAAGNPMGSVPTPLLKYRWMGEESFFAGIFRPYDVQSLVVVEYPNHEIDFDHKRETMVLTHGHYLDKAQTRFNDLSKRFSKANTPDEIKATRRGIFIATAQYQTAANAVSFTKGWRGFFNIIVGPGSDAFTRFSSRVANWFLYRLFPAEKREGEGLSQKQLGNIACYLKHFCGYVKSPRWFIFGHTHRQGRATIQEGALEVYNAGSCYPDRGMPMTFIEIGTDSGDMPVIQLRCVDRDGKVRESHPNEMV